MNVPISAVVAVGAILVIALLGGVAWSVLGGGSSAPYTIQGAIAEPTRENRLLPDRAGRESNTRYSSQRASR